MAKGALRDPFQQSQLGRVPQPYAQKLVDLGEYRRGITTGPSSSWTAARTRR